MTLFVEPQDIFELPGQLIDAQSDADDDGVSIGDVCLQKHHFPSIIPATM